MHFDNLIQWSSFFLTYIPIPAIHSIAITFQGIKMGISYFGIVTNQCEELLKVLYFAICICCFRIINIDQQYIYQIAQSIIKWSEFRDQTDSTGTRSRIIAVQTVEIIIKRHINRWVLLLSTYLSIPAAAKDYQINSILSHPPYAGDRRFPSPCHSNLS